MRSRSLVIIGVTGVTLAIFCALQQAYASVDLFDIDDHPVVLTATEQSREQVWNWFPATNPAFDNRYHFLGSWIRVGAGYESHGIRGFAELMSPFFINLPDAAIAPPPQGLLGLGANYYQRYMHAEDASVFLKQGYLEFGRTILEGFDVKGGRFEFFDGSEFTPRELNPQLKWLITNRMAQRLIGNFGFSDVMRSYDGGVASYGDDKWQATVMYGVPTKGVFDLNGMDEIRRTDLAYASLNAGPGFFKSDLWGDSMARVFYIYYSDTRKLTLADNSGVADNRPVSIDTFGGDYLRVINLGPGAADFLVWGATQFGAWGTLSQSAYAIAAEMGYRLNQVPWKPWTRVGFTDASGDGDKHDGTHGTFFQILPTPRIYAMTPFFNLMNIQDAMAQLVLNPLHDLEVQAAVHGLWLSSSHDLWYSGGGAYDNRFFGYSGRPASGHSYLGTLADCQLTWKINPHVSVQLYYGHIFGGDVIGSVYPQGREGDFGYIQGTFTL
jgi:Alginate export